MCPDMMAEMVTTVQGYAGLWRGHDVRDRQAMIRRSQRRMTRRRINGQRRPIMKLSKQTVVQVWYRSMDDDGGEYMIVTNEEDIIM